MKNQARLADQIINLLIDSELFDSVKFALIKNKKSMIFREPKSKSSLQLTN